MLLIRGHGLTSKPWHTRDWRVKRDFAPPLTRGAKQSVRLILVGAALACAAGETARRALRVLYRDPPYSVHPFRYGGLRSWLAAGTFVNFALTASQMSLVPDILMAMTPSMAISVSGPP